MASQSSSSTKAIPEMMAGYNQLLDLNIKNYNSMLAGYEKGQQNLAAMQGSINRAYGEVYRGVADTLGVGRGGWGVAAPAAQDIAAGLTRQQGKTQQQMIASGLGNSTLLAQQQNQNQFLANRAYADLGAKLADRAAGYAAQIGLAQAQAAQQGMGMQAQTLNNYLNTLGAYKFANTMGDLTGQFSQSSAAADYGGGGGGGHGGGVRGSAMGPLDLGGGYNPYNAMSSVGMGQQFYQPYNPNFGQFSGTPARGGGEPWSPESEEYQQAARGDFGGEEYYTGFDEGTGELY